MNQAYERMSLGMCRMNETNWTLQQPIDISTYGYMWWLMLHLAFQQTALNNNTARLFFSKYPNRIHSFSCKSEASGIDRLSTEPISIFCFFIEFRNWFNFFSCVSIPIMFRLIALMSLIFPMFHDFNKILIRLTFKLLCPLCHSSYAQTIPLRPNGCYYSYTLI